jgi:hypothetical protein
MLELVPKMAITKDDLPPFLTTWSDLFSPTCMFNSHQLRVWTSAHLRGAGWYLECGLKNVPDVERTLYDSAENANEVILLDGNDGSMDDAARAKAIAKIHAQDLKKKENIKALFEKELAKEEARQAKEAERKLVKNEKTRAKRAKADKVGNTNDSAVVDEAQSNRASKEVEKKQKVPLISSTQERLTQGPVVDEVADDSHLAKDELFLNSSFASLLPEDKPALPAFKDITTFLEKVFLVSEH